MKKKSKYGINLPKYPYGGGTPKAEYGVDYSTEPIRQPLPSIFDPVPQTDINNIMQKQTPSYGVGKPNNRFNINPLDFINGAAISTTVLANTINSNKNFRNEQRKYYQELNQPTFDSNQVINNNPLYMKDGGMLPQSNGVQRKYATVEAEGGEVYQQPNGAVVKIPDNAPSHEQGGVPINNVERVLENTSTSRKDKNSKSLVVTPDMMQEMFGIDIKGNLSHADALEKADAYFRKCADKHGKAIDKNLKELDVNKDNIYANNSLDLNVANLNKIPQRDDIFEHLFNHQEGVKQQMGIANPPHAKYGYDNDPYNTSKTKKGRTSDTGQNTTYNSDIQNSLDYINQLWKGVGINGKDMSNEDFQSQTYDYLLQNNPDAIRNSWKTYGINNKGKQSGKFDNLDFNNLSDEDLTSLKEAYVDGKLGARTLTPPTNVPIESTKPNVGYILPIPDGNAPSYSVADNPNIPNAGQSTTPQTGLNQSTAPSRFNEPLHWYDLAGPLMTLASSDRIPAKYNPININEVRLKLQNPEPSLAAGQRQYNQAAKFLPNNAAGMANNANLFANKYAADNNVFGNYENINTGIKNQETLYNANARDRQSAANAQSRQTFESQFLGSKEAERQQKLSAFDDLFTRVALNRKLNREGDLLMQMFPNYNQQGRYNGNQRYFFNQGAQPQSADAVSFKVQIDPTTGQRFRLGYDKNGKLVSNSKMITDDKTVGYKKP